MIIFTYYHTFFGDYNKEVIILNNLLNEVPIGFGMQLAKNLDAMTYFANLDDQRKQEVIERTRNINSKEEMEQFVASLASKDSFR